MATPDPHADDLDRRLQNELLRAQLEADLGASFGECEPSTPEQEGRFLEAIRDAEAGGTDAYVAIGSLVSRKVVKRAAAMARGRDFAGAIATVVEGLHQAGVTTDFAPPPLPLPAYYRWLTTALFAHTIPVPPKTQLNPADPSLRHVIGAMYAQVEARREREARSN